MHVTWELWIDLYTETWCVGRNLATSTIVAYRDVLRQFQGWATSEHLALEPTRLTTRIVLDYVVHLREKRGNGDAAISRTVVRHAEASREAADVAQFGGGSPGS
jgi:site-specific recombinase XerD